MVVGTHNGVQNKVRAKIILNVEGEKMRHRIMRKLVIGCVVATFFVFAIWPSVAKSKENSSFEKMPINDVASSLVVEHNEYSDSRDILDSKSCSITCNGSETCFEGLRNAAHYSHAVTILNEMKADHEKQCIDNGTSWSCRLGLIRSRRPGSKKRKVYLKTKCW